jgi:hypothetical protein
VNIQVRPKLTESASVAGPVPLSVDCASLFVPWFLSDNRYYGERKSVETLDTRSPFVYYSLLWNLPTPKVEFFAAARLIFVGSRASCWFVLVGSFNRQKAKFDGNLFSPALNLTVSAQFFRFPYKPGVFTRL